MAIFTRSNKTSLITALVEKGATERHNESFEAQAAKDFVVAAQVAQADSLAAAHRASAIEKAVTILEDAGVSV